MLHLHSPISLIVLTELKSTSVALIQFREVPISRRTLSIEKQKKIVQPSCLVICLVIVQ